MAGFKYYYGYNAENEARPEAERIPRIDYLQFIPGDTAAEEKISHAPVVIYRNRLGDATRPVSYTHLTLPTNREV
mgnify:CR=1 FL=1